jgi:enoyl-CoA hydratase
MSEGQAVLTEARDRVFVITINRPHVRNAIDTEAAEGIGKALERFDDDVSLGIAIITGAGGTFCSGMDLGGFLAGKKPRYADRGFAGITWKSARKPLIAAVEGYAVAGGFEIAIACDLIVASRTAKFAIPEVRRGLIAGAGALLRLPRRMPYHVVMELALTGDFIDAERLYHFGIVNRLVAKGTALEEAETLARHILEGGPLAIAATKRILVEQQDWTLENMWAKQDVYFRPAVDADDAREGAAAFKERRPPQWQAK